MGVVAGIQESSCPISIHEKVLIPVVGFDMYRLAATEILGFSTPVLNSAA
jgi:hypothetical protein